MCVITYRKYTLTNLTVKGVAVSLWAVTVAAPVCGLQPHVPATPAASIGVLAATGTPAGLVPAWRPS